MKIQNQICQIDDLCLYHLQETLNNWAKESITNDKEIRLKKQSRIHGALTVLKLIDDVDVIITRNKNHNIREVKLKRSKEPENGRS